MSRARAPVRTARAKLIGAMLRRKLKHQASGEAESQASWDEWVTLLKAKVVSISGVPAKYHIDIAVSLDEAAKAAARWAGASRTGAAADPHLGGDATVGAGAAQDTPVAARPGLGGRGAGHGQTMPFHAMHAPPATGASGDGAGDGTVAPAPLGGVMKSLFVTPLYVVNVLDSGLETEQFNAALAQVAVGE